MKSFLFLMVTAILFAFVAVIAPNDAEAPLLACALACLTLAFIFPKSRSYAANLFVRIMFAFQCAEWELTHRVRLFANASQNEGTHEGALITKLSAGAVTQRYLIVEIGADIDHIAPCNAAADIPLGISQDESTAAEQEVAVAALCGGNLGTLLVTSSAAITAGDMLVTDTAGKARTLPATTGTYYIIGRALQAATAADQIIEFAPCFPIQRVVP